MRNTYKRSMFVCSSAAVLTLAAAGSAFAQGAATQAAPVGELSEVVVTATRQSDTVNRVPLSVTAQTQATLDQRGIKTIQDMIANVPALAITNNISAGTVNLAIRGIRQGSEGAATTGFYIDDTPLQKRNMAGGVGTANGTPLPPLFDLDRIEVLRGPQGTLFGGSSEGGTVRYITPQPSLTRYSAYARGEVNTVHEGGTGWEGGVAVGGPIVQDKLGFRASVFRKHQAGFLDMFNAKTRTYQEQNVNAIDTKAIRLALTWAPSDRSKITLNYMGSTEHSDHGGGTFTQGTGGAFYLPVKGQLIQPTVCFNTTGIQNLPLGSQNRLDPLPVGSGDAQCAAMMASGAATHTLPGQTLGPYNLNEYDTLLLRKKPTDVHINIATLTADYDFDTFSFKAITSMFRDHSRVFSQENTQIGARTRFIVGGVPSVIYREPGQPDIAIPAGVPFQLAQFDSWIYNSHIMQSNKRYGFVQEFRFTSKPNSGPLSWVAGAYYSNIRGKGVYNIEYPEIENITQYLYGITATQRYGGGFIDGLGNGVANAFENKKQSLKDIEVAVFAEGNYQITDKLKATAGLRVSRVQFDYAYVHGGPILAIPAGTFQTGSGSVAESPVTPKFGLQYQLSNNDMVYVSAAKGFRAGGVNAIIPRSVCAAGLDLYGIDETKQLPRTYKSDSVWSYELGAKFRLFNRVQANLSAYQIDWQNPQVVTTFSGCGHITTWNATSARSRGVEAELQARLVAGFSASGSFGYNKSEYTADSFGPLGTRNIPFVIALKGQRFPQAPWTLSLAMRWDGRVASLPVYARADWRYSRGFEANPFGSPAWNPDSNVNPNQDWTNIRAGAVVGDFDVSLFANNLFNMDSANIGGGRTGCTPPPVGTQACTTFTGFNAFKTTNWGRPREIGLQVTYRQ